MIGVNIVLGLLGLGIVVIVHELGHFIAAKLSGIEVETFSIGWGRKVAGFNYRGTEYRLSALPIGGYCKLRGEEILKQAVETASDTVAPEKGSLFSVSPLKRIFTYFAGPLFNFIFAAFVLSIIWFGGFTIRTYENRIVLVSESPFAEADSYPADEAGIRTGDRIVEMNRRPVSSFYDIETVVSSNPENAIATIVDRNGESHALTLIPRLDRETGSGVIGVAAWIEPLIGAIDPESAAYRSGLRAGDRIVTANGIPIANSIDLAAATRDRPEQVAVTFERDGSLSGTAFAAEYADSGELASGFAFAAKTTLRRERNPFVAIARGTAEAVETFVMSIRSIGLLFRGVNMRSAVSGPIRITYFVGEIATESFSQGLGTGLVVSFRFLSLLSVALGFMNLLPIPALDGGMIVLLTGELIARRPMKPKVFYRYQIVGFLIILGLLVLSTFNDVFYFVGR